MILLQNLWRIINTKILYLIDYVDRTRGDWVSTKQNVERQQDCFQQRDQKALRTRSRGCSGFWRHRIHEMSGILEISAACNFRKFQTSCSGNCNYESRRVFAATVFFSATGNLYDWFFSRVLFKIYINFSDIWQHRDLQGGYVGCRWEFIIN